eukprot:TRINITY_DN7202_c0_g1_i1.p1 TRINITY_DN7202_c0_g1~~TRINITY_DN7202_c0_g1_i1.p1  ORF type:complete len:548 (-),score=73.26 TRINITY_DN7202_c0_g1_i1:9-1652(-)
MTLKPSSVNIDDLLAELKVTLAQQEWDTVDLGWRPLCSRGALDAAKLIVEKGGVTHVLLPHAKIKSSDAEFTDLLRTLLASPLELTTLDLTGNSLQKEGATVLGIFLTCSNTLTDLNLTNNNLENEGVAALAAIQTRHLKNLDLSANNLEQLEGGIIMRQLLHAHPNLKCLTLAQNDLGEGARFVLAGVASSSSITALDLSENGIDGEHISQALPHCLVGNLQRLNLAQNQLGDEAFAQLAQSLAASSLKYLNLANTGLTDFGVDAFGKALATVNSSPLEHIVLSENYLSGHSVASLFAVENKFTGLELDVSDTSLEAAICAIKQLCKPTASLKYLRVKSNSLSDADTHLLRDVLSKNTTLVGLDLRENHISNTGLSEMLHGATNNSTLMEILMDSGLDSQILDVLTANRQARASIQQENNQPTSPPKIPKLALSQVISGAQAVRSSRPGGIYSGRRAGDPPVAPLLISPRHAQPPPPPTYREFVPIPQACVSPRVPPNTFYTPAWAPAPIYGYPVIPAGLYYAPTPVQFQPAHYTTHYAIHVPLWQ